MNKTQQYADILADYILEFEAKFKDANDGLTTLSIIDNERHHYQSLLYGHQDDRFLFIVQFHFDIINDQIWLQQNNTDIDLGEELVNLGVPKSDIVLGFLSEFEREYSDYGVSNVLVNA